MLLAGRHGARSHAPSSRPIGSPGAVRPPLPDRALDRLCCGKAQMRTGIEAGPGGEPMTTVFVVYGSRHGGTRGIAERIGEVLQTRGDRGGRFGVRSDRRHPRRRCIRRRQRGLHGELAQGATGLHDAQPGDARRPTDLALQQRAAARLVEEHRDTDPVTVALGPVDGPGSGGRKKVEALSATIHPRDHRVFRGAFDPNDPPRTMAERLDSDGAGGRRASCRPATSATGTRSRPGLERSPRHWRRWPPDGSRDRERFGRADGQPASVAGSSTTTAVCPGRRYA